MRLPSLWALSGYIKSFNCSHVMELTDIIDLRIVILEYTTDALLSNKEKDINMELGIAG